MAYSSVDHVGNGTLVNFSTNFPFISPSYVAVFIDGAAQLNGTHYTLTDTTVTFSVAPASGAVVSLRRVTPRDHLLVEFVDATILTEDQLNLSQTQLLHIIQENIDAAESGSLSADEALSQAVVTSELAQQLGATLQAHIDDLALHSGGGSGGSGGGLAWKGPWSAIVDYVAGDVVSYDGSSYTALEPNTNTLPTITDSWDLLVAKGDTVVSGIVDGAITLLNKAAEDVPTPSEGITMFADRSSGVPIIQYKDSLGLVHSVGDGIDTRQLRYLWPRGTSGALALNTIGTAAMSNSFSINNSALVPANGGLNALNTFMVKTGTVNDSWGGWCCKDAGIRACGGLKFSFTYIYTSTIRTANHRYFVGLQLDGLTTNAPPSAILTTVNAIGVAMVPGSDNLHVFANGLNVNSAVDLGANFPVIDAGLAGYRLTIFKKPDVNTEYHYKVERLRTPHVATGTFTGIAGNTLFDTSAKLGIYQLLHNGSLGGVMQMEVGNVGLELFI